MKSIPGRGNSQYKGSNDGAFLVFSRYSKEADIDKVKKVRRKGHELQGVNGKRALSKTL